MKTRFIATAILAASSLPLLSGCVERTVYVRQPPPGQYGEVVVSEIPPAPQAEVVGVSPGPAYVWVPGYWTWQGRWVWIGGCWTIRLHPHAVWVGGHWGHRGHGYVWVRGYWR
jgi:hypothetical protein